MKSRINALRTNSLRPSSDLVSCLSPSSLGGGGHRRRRPRTLLFQVCSLLLLLFLPASLVSNLELCRLSPVAARHGVSLLAGGRNLSTFIAGGGRRSLSSCSRWSYDSISLSIQYRRRTLTDSTKIPIVSTFFRAEYEIKPDVQHGNPKPILSLLLPGVGLVFPATKTHLFKISHRILSRGTDEAVLTKAIGFYNCLTPPEETQSSLGSGSPTLTGKTTMKRSIPIVTSQLRISILTLHHSRLLPEVGRSTEVSVAAATAAGQVTKGYTLNLMGLKISKPNLQKFLLCMGSAHQEMSIKGNQPKSLNFNFLRLLSDVICDYEHSVEDPILFDLTIVTD